MLSQKKLKEILFYNKETGVFKYKIDRIPGAENGDIAGCLDVNGYVRIKINYKSYMAHRLAFLYVEGYFPEYEVDHRNGVRNDNRWSNLFHVTRNCNMQNQENRTDNTSGFNGVYWHKNNNKWCAEARINRKKVSLGYHVSAVDAALARLTWEINCESWGNNHRSQLIAAIKDVWPEFKTKNIVTDHD